MKTPITYYGGKQTLAKYILPLIPSHYLYCEPFFGGGAIFFAKPKSPVEIINDLNGEVVVFYEVLKTQFSALKKKITSTLHSRELFEKARFIYNNSSLHSKLDRAWAFWTLTNQGFAGQVTSWGFGRTPSKEKSLANKRESFSPDLSTRLATTQIECNDALKVIKRADTPDSFFYVDPPYIGSHQGHYQGYSESDYKKLLDALSSIKGKFLLSSYPSSILSKYIKKFKWHSKSIDKKIAVTKNTDKIKTEMLVANYPLNSSNSIKPLVMNVSKSLIKKFLSFNGKKLYKKQLGDFIDSITTAIKNRQITKSDPLSKEISKIQDAVVSAYNSMKYATVFGLKATTVKRLSKKIEESSLNGTPEIMASTEFEKLSFESLGFTGKWLKLIGDPCKGFSTMIFGKPKMGKSYLAMEFAGYLADHFGKVLFVAAEEKLDATLKKKLQDTKVASPSLYVSSIIPSKLSRYDFVFIDSVNKLRLTPSDLDTLRVQNPNTSFIFIFQTTKQGNFRGANEFQHDVDIVIEIPEKGRAVQFGRFNQGGELEIFDTSLQGANKKYRYPDWTKPDFLNEKDHQDLQEIYRYYKDGDFDSAFKKANRVDTIVREEIPLRILKEIGGNLTPSGEEKLRKEEHPEVLPDELNPEYLFSNTHTELLVSLLKSKVSIKNLIKSELRKRGLDFE